MRKKTKPTLILNLSNNNMFSLIGSDKIWRTGCGEAAIPKTRT
jgi:hypothetical protein